MTRKDATASAAPLPEAFAGKKQLTADDGFSFGCHPGVPCFNVCCHDVNVLLTPVDILKLARNRGMTTSELIEKHTLKPITKELRLPVLMLKMAGGEDKPCPFLTPEGCGVYADRPWACRMYPVAMGLPPARAGEEPKPVYFLLEDDFCKGHAETASWTVDRWRADQGLVERERLEAGYREMVSHPFFIGGQRHLNPKGMEMFFMAFYDLDTFRRFIFDSSFTQRFELESDYLESLRHDDEALLTFSSRWLRFALFQEPTMTARAEQTAPEPRRKT